MAKAIEAQFPQREIERSSWHYQRGVEQDEITVVGVNKYVGGDFAVKNEFRVDPEIEKSYVDNLAKMRKERDAESAAKLLNNVVETARGTGNLMPPIIAAVKGGCTLGEISASMEKVFGRYAPGAS
jgi:methylmalonyl-CoA mutase N-terminal domain/subunit